MVFENIEFSQAEKSAASFQHRVVKYICTEGLRDRELYRTLCENSRREYHHVTFDDINAASILPTHLQAWEPAISVDRDKNFHHSRWFTDFDLLPFFSDFVQLVQQSPTTNCGLVFPRVGMPKQLGMIVMLWDDSRRLPDACHQSRLDDALIIVQPTYHFIQQIGESL